MGVTVIDGGCPIMFGSIADPAHRVMRFVLGLTGKVPKRVSRGGTMANEERWEEIKVQGEQLLGKVRELVHEGNVRRIVIENEKGETLVELPLSVGVVGTLLLPMAAAVGAIAAVVTECTIRFDRRPEEPGDQQGD